MAEKKKDLSLEAAEEILRAAHQEKLKKCSDEINEVLKRYGFALDVAYQINLVPKR